MEEGEVDKQFFIPEERLYYTYPEIDHSDETKGKLPKEHRQTWQYVKGAKKSIEILKGLYTVKSIERNIDDFIEHISEWQTYIRIHCR